MNQGSYNKAFELWQALVEEFPDKLSNRIYLARALLELERFDEAIAALQLFETEAAGEPGSGQDPGDRQDGTELRRDEAFGILALSYRGKGELEKANLFIEKALEISPQSVEYLNNYGVILADRGMLDHAKIQWQKVLAIDPENKTARQNLSAFDR